MICASMKPYDIWDSMGNCKNKNEALAFIKDYSADRGFSFLSHLSKGGRDIVHPQKDPELDNILDTNTNIILHHMTKRHEGEPPPIIWEMAPAGRLNHTSYTNNRDFLNYQYGLTIPIYIAPNNWSAFIFRRNEKHPVVNSTMEKFIVELIIFFSYFTLRRLASMAKPSGEGVLTPDLTPREIECLSWVAAGKSSWETGVILNCSERTVNFHIGNAMRKLDVVKRPMAIARAMDLGLLTKPPGEPPRDSWRLQPLRRWSREEVKEVHT